MCCHLSPRWCKTSGWIIYISALWKPTFILGAITHNQEFSSQIRGRQRPLRHLLHAIRRRRKRSHQTFSLSGHRKKNQTTEQTPPPLLLHLSGITSATEKQFRRRSQSAPPLCFSFVLPGDYTPDEKILAFRWAAVHFLSDSIVRLVPHVFIPVFHIWIDSGCLRRWSPHSYSLILEAGLTQGFQQLKIISQLNICQWETTATTDIKLTIQLMHLWQIKLVYISIL